MTTPKETQAWGANVLQKGETSGRCHACQIRYTWKGLPRLRDAFCPGCGGKLKATTHLFKGTNCRAIPTSRQEREADSAYCKAHDC